MRKMSSVKRNAALLVIFLASTCFFLSYVDSHVRSEDTNKKNQQSNANKPKPRPQKDNKNAKPADGKEGEDQKDKNQEGEALDEAKVNEWLAKAEKALEATKTAQEGTLELTSKSGLSDSITNNSKFAEADDDATRKLNELGSTLQNVIQLGLMGKLKGKHEALNTALKNLNDIEKLDVSKITDESLQQKARGARDSIEDQTKLITDNMTAIRSLTTPCKRAARLFLKTYLIL